MFLLEKDAVLKLKHRFTVSLSTRNEKLTVKINLFEFVAYLRAHFLVLGVEEPVRLF